MKNIDNNNNSSSSSISNKTLNHYQEILLNSQYQPEKLDPSIRTPTIKRKYSPNLKFCNDGETVKYIKKPTTNTLVYSNFQTDYLSQRDDIIFYFEVEMIEMCDKSDICVGLGISTFPVHKQPGFSKKAKCSFGCKRNGEIRCSKIKSPQRIKVWGKGSIIGCGYNYITNEIFFTNDGEYKGAAFTTVRNYSFIGLVSLSYYKDKVRINFGKRPFKFDIRSLITEYKQQIDGQINSQKVDVFEIHKLVQQYLYFNGYFDSLKSFENQSLLLPIQYQMECEDNSMDKKNISEEDSSSDSHNSKYLKEKGYKESSIFQKNSLIKQLPQKCENIEEEEDLSPKTDRVSEEIRKNFEKYENILDLSSRFCDEEEEENYVKKRIRDELSKADCQQSLEINTKQDYRDNSEDDFEFSDQIGTDLYQNGEKGNQKKQVNGIDGNCYQIPVKVNEDDKQTIFDNIRKEIIVQLKQMNYSKVIDILKKEFPNIFEMNPQLEGKLISLQFIKLYKESKLDESMKYAQQNIKQMNDIKIEYVDTQGNEKYFTKLDILGAFCYENIENSHLSFLFQPYTQMKIWDEINYTLLQYSGYRSEGNLQIIMKQVNLIQQKMRENEMFECAMYKI